jgi:hypothetical protein
MGVVLHRNADPEWLCLYQSSTIGVLMAYIVSYSHDTFASIPEEAWDEAWFAIASWKGYLQSFPGMLSIRLSARALENGDVRFHSSLLWEDPEQLEEWRGSQWSMNSLLKTITPPAYDIDEETFEDLS